MLIESIKISSGLFVELSKEEQELLSGGITTRWACINRGNTAGQVDIWWGHTPEDAQWACNNWIPTCGNQGGCEAFRI